MPQSQTPQKAAPAAKSVNTAFRLRGVLIPVINAFMSEAGIANYKIKPPKSDEEYEITWDYEDGTFSTLTMLEPTAQLTLQTVADFSGKQAANGCDGEFALFRGPSRYFKGSEVQQVETRCKNGKGAIGVAYSKPEFGKTGSERIDQLCALADK